MKSEGAAGPSPRRVAALPACRKPRRRGYGCSSMEEAAHCIRTEAKNYAVLQIMAMELQTVHVPFTKVAGRAPTSSSGLGCSTTLPHSDGIAIAPAAANRKRADETAKNSRPATNANGTIFGSRPELRFDTGSARKWRLGSPSKVEIDNDISRARRAWRSALTWNMRSRRTGRCRRLSPVQPIYEADRCQADLSRTSPSAWNSALLAGQSRHRRAVFDTNGALSDPHRRAIG